MVFEFGGDRVKLSVGQAGAKESFQGIRPPGNLTPIDLLKMSFQIRPCLEQFAPGLKDASFLR
jgi:hypothetical protein